MGRMFVGIDLGTSAIKAVLIDENKKVVAQTAEEYQISQPQPGWSEMDQEIWFEGMKKAILRVLEGCEKTQVKGIGVTGQMHTLTVLDENGKPIRPAMMWNDLRTKDLLGQLKEKMKDYEEGEYLSRTISTGSPAANLCWLKTHEPENFGKIRKFLIGPDYLIYRLTGVCGTDYCEASTSCLYELQNKRWSPGMRELIGLPEEVYPQVKASAAVAGNLTEEMAGVLGLGTDVKVLVGTGDNPATAISTGCLGRGYPVISLGTSGVLMMPVQNRTEQAKGKKILFSFDDKTYYNLVQGVVQSNGSTFEWWGRTIMGLEDFHEIDGEVDLDRARQNRVIFYPHLVGDKTIYGDPNIRGAFVGLSMDMERTDMVYAVLEGLCFSFRELADEMQLPIGEFGSVRVVGGGAKSKIWMQTLANVLNTRIEKLDGMIGAAFGAALLAAYQDGCYDSLEQITEGTVKTECCFEPEPVMSSICEKKYRKYLRMQKGLKYITEGEAV